MTQNIHTVGPGACILTLNQVTSKTIVSIFDAINPQDWTRMMASSIQCNVRYMYRRVLYVYEVVGRRCIKKNNPESLCCWWYSVVTSEYPSSYFFYLLIYLLACFPIPYFVCVFLSILPSSYFVLFAYFLIPYFFSVFLSILPFSCSLHSRSIYSVLLCAKQYVDPINTLNTSEMWCVTGNLLLSSIDYGLLVVKPDWEAIEAIPPDADIGFRTRSRELLESVNRVTCASPWLQEREICEASQMC